MRSDLLNLLAAVMLLIPFALGAAGLALLWLWPAQSSSKQAVRGIAYATVVASLVELAISLLLAGALRGQPALYFSWPLRVVQVDFHIDVLSIFFILLVNVIGFVAAWNAVHTVHTPTGESRLLHHPVFFHASINLFHFTMLLVPMVDNLIGLWIAIEATTLVSALLVAYQNTRNAWEAAWKYLLITSTGIVLALLGTMFLANASHEVNLLLVPTDEQGRPLDSIMNWTFLMVLARGGALTDAALLVKLSFLLVLVGYGTKAGLAPMHTWLPDGHGEAPAPVSALLSGVLLKSALYAILRFYTITNTVLNDGRRFTSTMMLGAGLLSLLVATPFILKENRFKRVLAYHSLEHMGIITFGIGIGGPIALAGALLHTLNHAITKALMFLSFGNIMQRYEEHALAHGRTLDPADITGVLRSMPATGLLLTLGGLALVGTPPFNIFLSEFIILWGTLSRPLNAPTIGAALLFLLSTTLIFYGLVRHLSRLVLHRMPDEQRFRETPAELFPLVLLFTLVLLAGIGIVPPLAGLLNESVRIVLDGTASTSTGIGPGIIGGAP